MFANLCNVPSSLQQLNFARDMLIENGICGLSGRDFKLLSAEQKKMSLYNELSENGESDGHRVSSGLPANLQQTNMSFLDNETDDLICSPCEDPVRCSHAFCECTGTERASSTGEAGYSTVNMRRGKITYELGRRRKTLLAPLRKTKGSSEW